VSISEWIGYSLRGQSLAKKQTASTADGFRRRPESIAPSFVDPPPETYESANCTMKSPAGLKLW
jgi:hypothetical protein